MGPEQDGYEIEVLKKLSIPIEIPENYVADPNIPDSDIEDAEIAEAIMAGLNMDNAVIAEDAIANWWCYHSIIVEGGVYSFSSVFLFKFDVKSFFLFSLLAINTSTFNNYSKW